MPSRGSRNNIFAGLFVVVSLVLGVWVSFVLSDRPAMGGMRHFTIRFTLEDGATGLKSGSPVLLAGQQIGRVRSVDFAKTAEGFATSVNVAVEVRSDLTLYENAGIFLQLPLLGTLSSINISSIGSPTAATHAGSVPTIEESEIVLGHIAPPGFLAQAGFGGEQAAQLKSAMAALDNAVTRASQLIEKSGPKLDASISDAQAVLANLKDKLASWSEKIDKTAANIEQASGRLEPMLAKADTGLDSANAAIAEVREVIRSNKDKLGQILDNVQSATGKIDQETLTEVNAAIKEGREALGVFSTALGKLSTTVTEETPSIRRTLANLRLMSDQLKLTAVEVRSQPWRLLHQPTTKELSSQVLYDATRAYAEAASDLRAASEALEATSAQPSQDVVEALTRTVTKYKAAEQALMDKLIENDKK